MSKSFGNLAFVDGDPVYVLVRHQYPEKRQSRYEIWVEEDSLSISPTQLSELLADTIQNVISPTNTN